MAVATQFEDDVVLGIYEPIVGTAISALNPTLARQHLQQKMLQRSQRAQRQSLQSGAGCPVD
jgi:hypothetical protein